MHSIRVKHIQEEYQKYMERVRGKAQSAIDQANSQYQNSRTMLTARVDALVHFLQTRHLQVRAPGCWASSQCFAKCPFYPSLFRPGQICRLFDRLSDQFAKHCLEPLNPEGQGGSTN